MLYRHDSYVNKLAKRKNIALGIFVVVSIFALLFNPVRGVLTEAVFSVSGSIWGVGNTASNVWNSFFVNFQDKNALAAENKLLRDEVDTMQAQVLDRNLLADKIVTLESALGRVVTDNRVAANVMIDSRRSPYDILVLDVGSDNGVAVGNLVVYAGSGVIGEIVETTSTTAKAKLYSTGGEETAVIIGQKYIPATAVGQGMGNFEAKVPQASVIEVGDNIVTTKGNLLLGSVALVEEKPAEPFKRVFFRVPFNITEIHSVEVITTNKHS